MVEDIDTQIRVAFARVKEDVRSLRESIEGARRRVDSIHLSLSQYTDKHEFYEFVKSLRSELDSMYASLATKKDLSELTQNVRKVSQSLETKNNQITALQQRLSEMLSKSEFKRREEIADTASREMALRLLKIERSYEKVKDDLSEVRKELRLKNRQLEKAQLYPSKLSPSKISASKVSIPTKLEIPRTVFIGAGLVVLIILLLAVAIPSFRETTIKSNDTNNTQFTDAQVKDMSCVAEFECNQLAPNSYYAGCIFDPTIGDEGKCKCDLVSSPDFCDYDQKLEAEGNLRDINGLPFFFNPIFLLVIIVLLFFGALWYAGRKNREE